MFMDLECNRDTNTSIFIHLSWYTCVCYSVLCLQLTNCAYFEVLNPLGSLIQLNVQYLVHRYQYSKLTNTETFTPQST